MAVAGTKTLAQRMNKQFEIRSFLGKSTLVFDLFSAPPFSLRYAGCLYYFCPISICSAKSTTDNSDALSDMLSQHLRLHVELRCCMDCATVLPNNTLNMTVDSQPEHKCSQLVSSLHKDHKTKSNTPLQFNATSFLVSPSKNDPSGLTVPTKNVIPIRIPSE